MRVILLSCVWLVWLVAVPAAAQQPVVIKFSHVVAPATPKGRAAEHFAKLVNARLAGRVRVEVYPDSRLFKDGEEMEALQLGTVQMLAPSFAKLSPLGAPAFELFDLPFLFDDYEALHRITEGPVGRLLFKALEPRGLTGLAFWDNGFKQFSANRPLRSPADFKGLRLRIQSSRVLDAQTRALGAIPYVMGFSDVTEGLRKGEVDGAENPPSTFYAHRMYETQKYLVQSNHGYLGYAVIVNKKFWDGLPADIRKTLEDTMAETTRHANQIALQDNAEALAAIRATGSTKILDLSPAERREFKRLLLAVHRSQTSRIGVDLMREVYRETGFDPGSL